MSVQLKDWFDGGAVSVQRGPLVYSLKIDEKRVESQHEPDAIRQDSERKQCAGFSRRGIFPAGEWRLAWTRPRRKRAGKIQSH
jgi:hypothetical protein